MGYKFNPFTGNFDATDSPNGVFEAVEVNGDINLDDGGTYATTLQLITPTANHTISFPDATGTVALVGGSSGQLIYNNAGAYAGDGNLTWDATAGLTLGRKVLVNEQSGFSGNLLDLQVAGSSKLGFIGNTYLRLGSGTGGIQFNGDTAAANALDDYEEGTWTPVFIGTSTAGTPTYGTNGQAGKYTKVGNKVTAWAYIDVTALGGAAGNINITGLPFAISNIGLGVSGISVGHADGTLGNGVRAYHNTTFLELRNNNSVVTAATGQIYVSITYTT